MTQSESEIEYKCNICGSEKVVQLHRTYTTDTEFYDVFLCQTHKHIEPKKIEKNYIEE